MHTEIKEQIHTVATHVKESEQSVRWLCIPTSSLRKRVLIGLQLWLSAELSPDSVPDILTAPEVAQYGIDWQEVLREKNPEEIVQQLARIPNGNGVASVVHMIGVWRGYQVLAVPNGGEQHLATSTPQTEAQSKAVFDVRELLELLGDDVTVLAMDGEDLAQRVKRDSAASDVPALLYSTQGDRAVQALALQRAQASGAVLGKPRRDFTNTAITPSDDGFSDEYFGYLRAKQLLLPEGYESMLINIVSIALVRVAQVLQETGQIIAEVGVTTTYLRYVEKITDELATQLLTGADPDAAGFQFFQRVAAKTSRWEELVAVFSQWMDEHAKMHGESLNQVWEEVQTFLLMAHIMGTNILPVLFQLETLPKESIVIEKRQEHGVA